MFVKIDSDKHPEHAENIHFNVESKDEFEQDKVDGERRVDARRKVRGKDALNGALRCHDVKNLSEYPAQKSSDQYKDEQNPRRFSHAATLLSLWVSIQVIRWWLKGTISEGFRHVNKTTDCTCRCLDLPSSVRYTPRCSFSRIFEAIGDLVQGFDGLFLLVTGCSMR